MIYLRKIIVILFVFLTFQVKAQDFPYHYFTHVNPFVNNPSLAAFNNNYRVDVASHNLWAGGFKPLNDYLVSFSFSPRGNRYNNAKNPSASKSKSQNSFYPFAPSGRNYNRKTSFLSNVGLGVVFLKEQIGPFNQDILHLVYAYHILISEKTIFSLGISGMLENININVNSLTPLEPDDPRLLAGNNNSLLFDGGFGATISGEKYKIAISSLNIVQSTHRFTETSVAEITNYRKFFISGSYVLRTNNFFSFKPEITLRNSRDNTLNFDTSVTCNIAQLFFGMGYRSENAIFIFTKIPFKEFVFSYTSENAMDSKHLIGNAHTFSVSWTM